VCDNCAGQPGTGTAVLLRCNPEVPAEGGGFVRRAYGAAVLADWRGMEDSGRSDCPECHSACRYRAAGLLFEVNLLRDRQRRSKPAAKNHTWPLKGNVMLRVNRYICSALYTFVAVMVPPLGSAQDPGCTFTGNSACGGTDRGQCAPHERFYSEQCAGGAVRNKCFVDNYCASVNKGRINIGGAWRGGAYIIRQLGDTLNITGGSAGPATGQFVGPYTIKVAWGAAQFTGVVATNGSQITWDHPANNFWRR
jgi:hypothetical protein